eukprot:UN04286
MDNSVKYMVFMNQMLIVLHDKHYMTMHSSCASYNIEDNILCGEVDVLKKILKRTQEQIEHEIKQHKLFDFDELDKMNDYYEDNHHQILDLNFYFRVAKAENPDFKPGQIYECVDEDFDGAAIFYITLYKEDPNDTMAQQWLMEHGYFDEKQQAELFLFFGDEKPMDIKR